MKKIAITLIAFIICFLPAGESFVVRAQDASHHETATAEDSGDWGLLGLLGLIGLLGLKKKKYPETTRMDRRDNP